MSSPAGRQTLGLRLIRFAFWVLYNPLAWTYDVVSWLVSAGRWRAWQRVVLPEVDGERVLELAFGTGDLLLDVAAREQDALIGIDLSPAMGRVAQRKLRRAGVHIPLVRGRAQQLPFARASFDTIISTFPSDFVFSAETLSEIARLLSPQGKALIVVLAHLLPDTIWERLLEWLYQITGQRAPLPALDDRLAALGLERRMVWRTVERSKVLLVVLCHTQPS